MPQAYMILQLVNVGPIRFQPDANLADALLVAHEGGVTAKCAPYITGEIAGQYVCIGITDITAGEIVNRLLFGEALNTALIQDVAARWVRAA